MSDVDVLNVVKDEHARVRSKIEILLNQQVALERVMELLSPNGKAKQLVLDDKFTAPKASRTRAGHRKTAHNGLQGEVRKAVAAASKPVTADMVVTWLRENGRKDPMRYKTKLRSRVIGALAKLERQDRVQRVANGLYQAVGR